MLDSNGAAPPAPISPDNALLSKAQPANPNQQPGPTDGSLNITPVGSVRKKKQSKSAAEVRQLPARNFQRLQ